MKSIRIGNDIRIEWPIVLSGDVSKLQDLDLTVEVRPSAKVVDWHNYIEQPTLHRGKHSVMMNGGIAFRPDIGDGKEHCHPHRPKPAVPYVKLPYHIEDNTLIAMWTADRQFAVGDYDIILYAHKNEGGQAVCDQYRFVRLVAHSAQADAPDDSGIEAVIAMQPLTLSLSGLSAYEVAVVNGFQGSVEEWLESLKAGKLSSYVSVESIDNLPQQGDESTGYIIGTKLYIYVGTGGDTLEGKYKDVGEFRGPQGAPGSNGKSAYELAVEGGYEGSVEEWLLSLKGRDGVDGENGKDGLTPLIRWNNNRLEQSTDNGKSWWALSDKFNNKLYIKGYVTSADKLPKNALVGDMYGVGPIYGDDDVEQTKPYYQVYVNTVTDWAKSATITKVYQGDTELPQSAENNEIILIKKSTDNYLVYKYVNGSWNLLANLAEIYVEKDDIVNRGDNIFALVQSEIENQYELYERVVSWRNSGTFTSITAGIVQETGDSETAVMSQKAVTEKLNTVNDKINNQIPEIEAAKDAALNEIEDTEQEAISNFSAQRVTPEMLSEGVKQLIETAGGGTINNLPDEEDITSTSSDTPVLKFKDKAYNPSGFSGLATKILRKNILGSKNVLAQEMVSDANTIYEIRYDFDLNGATITVPDNCVLKFNGGSIDNGTLKGTGTMLEANLYQIFGENLVFSGTFNIDEVYAEWWGAKSYVHKQSKINSDFPFWDTPQEVEALPDCSSAFNKALDFCGKYAGGVVRALATMYKVENTITIPAETSLYTEESTYFIVYMQGDGKTVVTQNLDTYKFSSETLDENAYTLDFNQLIATESMAVAFKMNSRRTSFKGRGTISINHSRYTIGLLINGNYYDGVDMSYRPYVDIRSVGGDWGQIGIDTGTDILDEAPTDDTLNETGKTLYAWDKSTKTLYGKANGQTTWINKGYYSNYFNTSVRIDIDGSDCRLINPYICFGDARGFRGLEIYVHNGAWFNISKFEGCISYKHGGFMSIFTDSAVVAHDWQKVQCQLDKTQYDCKFFYAAKAEYIQVAAESDLPYINMPNDWKAFYLGKGTIGITIPSIGGSLCYVEDLGNNNKYNMYSLNPSSYQDVYSNTYFNALEGYNPVNAGVLDVLKVNILKEKVAADELDTITDNIENVNDKDISYLFDGDPSTKETLIDIDNGIYGTVMTLLKGGAETNFISTSIAPQWIEVDYYIHGNNSDGIYLVMGGSIGITKTSLIKKKLNRSNYERVERLFIPVGSSNKNIKMAVVSTAETRGLKVYVYAIRYWVNSYRYNTAGAAFAEKKVLKAGERLIGNEKLFVNVGDAKNVVLKRIEMSEHRNPIILRANSSEQPIVRLGAYLNKGKIEHRNSDSNSGLYDRSSGGYINQKENFSSFDGYVSKIGETEGEVYHRLLLQNIRSAEIGNFYGYSSDLRNIETVNIYGRCLMFDTEDISGNFVDVKSLRLESFKSNGSGKKVPLWIGNFKALESLQIIRPDANVFKVYGNIADLPYSLKSLILNSCDTSELVYSTKPYTHYWNESFTILSIDTECTSMTTDMVDALLIDLAWCVKATEGTRSVSLPKMKRTAASDDAVAALEELGFTVNVPLQAEE